MNTLSEESPGLVEEPFFNSYLDLVFCELLFFKSFFESIEDMLVANLGRGF